MIISLTRCPASQLANHLQYRAEGGAQGQRGQDRAHQDLQRSGKYVYSNRDVLSELGLPEPVKINRKQPLRPGSRWVDRANRALLDSPMLTGQACPSHYLASFYTTHTQKQHPSASTNIYRYCISLKIAERIATPHLRARAPPCGGSGALNALSGTGPLHPLEEGALHQRSGSLRLSSPPSVRHS